MRRFECIEGNSNKFWEIELVQSELQIRYGKIGTQGQSQTKSFADEAKATTAMNKLVTEKTGKGYVEVDAASQTPVVKQPESQALTANGPEPAKRPPWLIQGEALPIPEGWLEVAMPSRRFPQPCESEEVDWTLRHLWARFGNCVFHDREDAPPTWVKAFDETMSRLANAQQEGSFESDVMLLALTIVINDYAGEDLVDWLVASRGLTYAMNVLLAAEQLGIDEHCDDYDHPGIQLWSFVVKTLLGSSSGPFGRTEWRFRHHLAVASQAEYDACVARIREVLPAIPSCRQPLFGLILPDHPTLSEELARQLVGPDAHKSVRWLLTTVVDEDVIRLLKTMPVDRWDRSPWENQEHIIAVLLERGLAALDVLETTSAWYQLDEWLTEVNHPKVVGLLLQIETRYSARRLAYLTQFMASFPAAAMAGLAEWLAATTEPQELPQHFLAQLCMGYRELWPSIQPWLSEGAQRIMADMLAKLAEPATVATVDELPVVLVNPPWLTAKKKTVVKALSLSPLPLADLDARDRQQLDRTLQLPDWVRAALAKAQKNTETLVHELGFTVHYHSSEKQKPKLFKQVLAKATQAITDQDSAALIASWQDYQQHELGYWYQWEGHAVSVLPGEMALALWNAAGADKWCDTGYLIAKLGFAGIPGLVASLMQQPSRDVYYAVELGSVALALPMARIVSKYKSLRKFGLAWLTRFPEHAACGLIAPALGAAGEAREQATYALRLLAQGGHRALLLDVAGRYDDPAVLTALQTVLDESPLDLFPAKRSKAPDFWLPNLWRRPVLKSNGKPLGDVALEHLGTMLRFPVADGVYAGLADVKATCTAASLADFAWDCFHTWYHVVDAPGKESWALMALGVLGDDNTARKLTPYIRDWPGESQHARAASGVDVLALIGSDVSLMLLNGIAQKVKYRALQGAAQTKIQQIAAQRDLTTEELEDRLVPMLGLDEQGMQVLDFGPRQFRVGFDETLKPYVRDNDNKRLADLPKPRKDDDAELAGAAVERWKLLKKDVRTVASLQITRLEKAMCTRRRWTVSVFQQFLVEHPLMRHLVHRLVWGVYEVEDDAVDGGTLLSCFRVAEDGRFTTSDDDEITLPAGEQIRLGVVHRLELTDQQVMAFGQLFADYELIQPFNQLSREAYALTVAEQATAQLTRWDTMKVPTGKVLGLVNRGWERGAVRDGGSVWDFTKILGQGFSIDLPLNPGFCVGITHEVEEQELGPISLSQYDPSQSNSAPGVFASLDAIAISELIRDMENLRS
ncbi:WGR and DUF4132 domain-containing protein [Chitinivorax sp. B]|uniref:WGR and DUF4132 domain-containing protein n=1 Tax=Chitinivorax sp. B TaxID=2502235 RepID=UPI0010F622DD|nr:WGR and DUF4132 domain-containing protein [Chitinivorax sp. B]